MTEQQRDYYEEDMYDVQKGNQHSQYQRPFTQFSQVWKVLLGMEERREASEW